MTVQLNILEAIEQRNAGIQTAIDHANSDNPGWSEKAFEEFKRFLVINPGEFMAEQFRCHCAVIDFPLPPHARAFGGIIRKASNAGIIKFVRYQQVSNPKAHACFASVWIAA